MKFQSYSPMSTKTLSAALAHIRQNIAGLTDTPGLDAQVLLAYACKKDRTWVLAHPEYELNAEDTLRIADALAQIYAGVPLPYIIE